MFCWLVPRHEAKVAAATWTKIRLPQQHVSGGANRSPRTPRATGREGEWLAALVCTPPVLSRPGVRRAPATASITKVNNRSLCDLIHHDARELAMRRPSVSTLLWRFAARSPRRNPRKRNPSGCRQLAISYTVHTKIRQNVLDQTTDTTSSNNCQG